jgi:hypothetical protein
MKYFALAAVAVTVGSFGLSNGARAATVLIADINTVPGASDNSLVPNSTTGTVALRVGWNPGQWRSPFQNTDQTPINPQHDTQQYLSIQSNSSAVWNVGSSINTLSLFWGSPDSYNKIEFFAAPNAAGVAFDSLTGNAVIPPATAQVGHVLASILASGFFQSVRLSSINQNAFELTNVAFSCNGQDCRDPGPSPTPIPGAALLMGSVLAGGAGMQIMRRRRKAA